MWKWANDIVSDSQMKITLEHKEENGSMKVILLFSSRHKKWGKSTQNKIDIIRMVGIYLDFYPKTPDENLW